MNQSLLEKLLDYYSLSYEQYLLLNKDYSLANFDDGYHFDNIEAASELVKEYIKNDKKIAIYGDYDADGIMGTSILVKMFHYLDYEPDYYVPSRYIDGYGITLKKAKEYIEKGINLVITVDNGISAFEPISLLKENNIKVIVLDHHTPGETLPNADYILHPFVSNYSKIASSGAFVAFSFSRVVLGRDDKYLSTLAAISLISDMMPLKEQNRNLLKCVLKNYQVGEFLPIDLLADSEGFDENIIGSKIAPRINSIGRLIEDESINKLIPFFMNEDDTYVLNYFKYINDVNEERKNITKTIGDSIVVDNTKSAIIIKGNYKEGLIGLFANSLLNKYKKPVIVFTPSNENGILKGSARSIEGLNIIETFKKLENYFTAFGGHALAAGCSLNERDFDEFCTKFIEIVDLSPIVVPEIKTIQITLNDVNKENYELIKTFSPFGEEWNAPYLLIKNIKVSSLFYSKTGEHIFTTLGLGTRLVGFGLSRHYMNQFTFIDVCGNLKVSSFNNYIYTDFVIKKIMNN